MSDAALSHQNRDVEGWDRILHHLERQWRPQEKISEALKTANAAFAAQYMRPDGHKYAEACDQLASFLDLGIGMEVPDQILLVQTLQVACAMHDNAINNSELSKTQQSAHHLASTSLVLLCKNALDGNITHSDLWCEAFALACRAEQALAHAVDALDVSKYFDFEQMTDDFPEFENGTTVFGTSAAPSPVPTVSESATSKPSTHDIISVFELSPKDKAPATSNDRSSRAKGAPLGRAHTMPAVLHPSSASPSYHSQMGRAPLKPHPRRHDLYVVQETDE